MQRILYPLSRILYPSNRVLYPLIFILALLSASGQAGAVAVKDVENVFVKDSTRYVTDMAGMLSPQGLRQADALMADIRHKTGAEAVIVIVDNLDGEDADDYATELFDLWKPGKKQTDSGLILLISKEDRQMVIRTGYGLEGVLPDAICWEIINQKMAPLFKKEQYEEGILAGATALNGALTNEQARAEILQDYERNADRKDDEGNFLVTFVCFGLVVLGCLLIYYIYLLATTSKMQPTEAYFKFESSRITPIVATAATLGVAFPAWLLWYFTMKHIRNKRRICSNCGTPMDKLDEETDNNYLTPAQDTEERINSVDYDVWLCPNCHQTEIIPYINKQSSFGICDRCGARTMAQVSDCVVRQPSTSHTGERVVTCHCSNCDH